MDELIRQLEDFTQRFLNEMDEADYEAAEQFVEQREAIITRIKESSETKPLLEKHKIAINRLLQADAAITRKLTSLRNEATRHINDFQKASTQRGAYDASPAYGSHFFDSQK